MDKKALNRAAIYVKSPARLSQDDADRQTQMGETMEFCEGQGLRIGVWFGDPKDSREGFGQMMAEATSGEPRFDHVVVWKLRYFAWSLEESVLAREKLAASGVRLLSVKERLADG